MHSVNSNQTISAIETLSCDAGWRNYHFCKITTSGGLVGWSEYDEGFGAPGVGFIINRLASRAVGLSIGDTERVYTTLHAATRPASGGAIGLAIAAIENAVLDAKAKALGVPCYELLGGKVRDKLRVYWSHCATWRIARSQYYNPPITHIDGVVSLGREVHEKGFSALKTNIFSYDAAGIPRGWSPGFGSPFYPELNASKEQLKGIRRHLDALREGSSADVEMLLDLNFNFKPDGVIRILQELADIDLLWVEYDTDSPQALADIRRHSSHAIASCETLIGLREFLPFFQAQAVDVPIIDVVWNGAWQSVKIAAAAEAFELNVAPHNFYGHLSTMISAHFAIAVPNLRIVEVDIDRIDADQHIFTHEPDIRDGHMIVPDRPGWGTEPDEEFVRRNPPKSDADLMNLGPRKHVF